MAQTTNHPTSTVVKLSAIICTRNRADLLQKVIESIIAQNFSIYNYELIIIDNASTDSTAQKIKHFQKRASNIRYVYEAKVGLSAARNRGWKEAKGSWVLYLDDDAIADPNLFQRIIEGIQNYHADAYGGPIHSYFEIPPPKWLKTKLLLGYYGELYLGQKIRVMQYPDCPNGSNMTIRKDILEKFSFAEDLGRKDNALMCAEESDLFLKMDFAKLKTVYLPDAKVKHFVPKEKMTKKFLRRRAYAQGCSDAILFKKLDASKRWGFLLRKLKSEIRRIILHFFIRTFENFFELETRMHYLCGLVIQTFTFKSK